MGTAVEEDKSKNLEIRNRKSAVHGFPLVGAAAVEEEAEEEEMIVMKTKSQQNRIAQEPQHEEDREEVVPVAKGKLYKEKLQENDQILFPTTRTMTILTARSI